MVATDVPVVILAGGRGARFDHESQVLPKPLIQVAGKPILQHILDGFMVQGFRRFIIAVGYLGEKVADHFRDWVLLSDVPHGKVFITTAPSGPVTVAVVPTGEDSHTGERLARLEPLLRNHPFVLTYGDGLSNVDVRDVIVHHHYYSDQSRRRGEHPPLMTMTVVNPPGRFGVVDFFDGMPDGLVKSFGEKPTQDWINGGFMYVDPQFLHKYIVDSDGSYRLEDQAIPALAAHRRLLGYRHDGYWRCMDTRRDLEQIEKDVTANNGELPWMNFEAW